jgi:hypothetical protein
MSIKDIVSYSKQSNYLSAQQEIDKVLQDSSRADFNQAVILQFSLLKKQLDAKNITPSEYANTVLEKVKKIQPSCLDKETLRDYLNGKIKEINNQ